MASPRPVAAYAVAPVALAVMVDRVVAVIRRHVLADCEPSAWITLGRAEGGRGQIAGLVLLYLSAVRPRQPVDGQGTAPDGAGRRPAARTSRNGPRRRQPDPSRIKKPFGSPCTALTCITETEAKPAGSPRLAPQAGLQAGTGRSYLYAELDSKSS